MRTKKDITRLILDIEVGDVIRIEQPRKNRNKKPAKGFYAVMADKSGVLDDCTIVMLSESDLQKTTLKQQLSMLSNFTYEKCTVDNCSERLAYLVMLGEEIKERPSRINDANFISVLEMIILETPDEATGEATLFTCNGDLSWYICGRYVGKVNGESDEDYFERLWRVKESDEKMKEEIEARMIGIFGEKYRSEWNEERNNVSKK